MKMTDTCWCVCYYCYDVEESYFNIECGYYGNQAKEQAIKKAIDMNIEYIKELCEEDVLSCEGFDILNDTNISNEEKLKKYIKYLDHGNHRYYNETFYDVREVDLLNQL